MTMSILNRAAGALLALALASALVGCAAGWDKSFFTLEDALTSPDLTTVTNANNDTDTLCGGVSGCIEGWTTDQADFLRFDSNEAADEFAAEATQDRYHSNRVVIDFQRTQPSAEVRKLMIEWIDGVHNSE